MAQTTTFVIETLLPDGPHWYAGIRKQATIQGPEWTPYFEDRLEFPNKQLAVITFNTVCSKQEGAHIVTVGESMKDHSRWANKGAYYMRARYLTMGMQVGVANMPGVWRVISISKRGKRTLTAPGIDHKIYFTDKSTQWVKILGKTQTDERNSN